jgi:Ca2+-binding EF-hand superfamily protein
MIKSILQIVTIWSLALSAHLVFGEENREPPQRPAFSDVDVNGDGIVTLEEFKEQKIRGGNHEEIFSHIDANQDQQITEDEFTNHKPPQRDRPQR